MTPEELKKHSIMIEDSVSFIEGRAEDICSKFDEIDDCFTDDCAEEREKLKAELGAYLDKLQNEEKMIDQYEEILHNKTGIR